MTRGHFCERIFKRRRFERLSQSLKCIGAGRGHARLLRRNDFFHRLRADADFQRIDGPSALLQIDQKTRFDVPQTRRQGVMSRKKRKHAILYEPRFYIGAEIIRQQRRKIPLERCHLLDPRAQREKLTGAAEDVGQRLGLTRIKALRRP